MNHTDNCGLSGRSDVRVANCKMDCACKCHKAKPHVHKCQLCSECKARLQAAEEMAREVKAVLESPRGSIFVFLELAFAAWEKAGRGRDDVSSVF